MDTSLSDPAFFFQKFVDTLMGCCTTHVDDNINAQNEDYGKEITKLKNVFGCKP